MSGFTAESMAHDFKHASVSLMCSHVRVWERACLCVCMRSGCYFLTPAFSALIDPSLMEQSINQSINQPTICRILYPWAREKQRYAWVEARMRRCTFSIYQRPTRVLIGLPDGINYLEYVRLFKVGDIRVGRSRTHLSKDERKKRILIHNDYEIGFFSLAPRYTIYFKHLMNLFGLIYISLRFLIGAGFDFR